MKKLNFRLAWSAMFVVGFIAANGAGAQTTAAAPSVEKLQRYQIDPAKVFVAGISSGGFAAVQMHVAHSATFNATAC